MSLPVLCEVYPSQAANCSSEAEAAKRKKRWEECRSFKSKYTPTLKPFPFPLISQWDAESFCQFGQIWWSAGLAWLGGESSCRFQASSGRTLGYIY